MPNFSVDFLLSDPPPVQANAAVFARFSCCLLVSLTLPEFQSCTPKWENMTHDTKTAITLDWTVVETRGLHHWKAEMILYYRFFDFSEP